MPILWFLTHERPIFQILVAKFLEDSIGQHVTRVVQSGDAILEFLEALERLSFSFIEDRVSKFLADTRKEI